MEIGSWFIVEIWKANARIRLGTKPEAAALNAKMQRTGTESTIVITAQSYAFYALSLSSILAMIIFSYYGNQADSNCDPRLSRFKVICSRWLMAVLFVRTNALA
jgi:hypothetical protein